MSERRSSPDKDRGRQNVVVGDLVQMCHTNPDLQSDSDRLKEHLAATQSPPPHHHHRGSSSSSPLFGSPILKLFSLLSLRLRLISPFASLHSSHFSFFYSASSLSPLIFSEHLLDSVFSKFVPSLLLFLFLVITLLHSFERDVSLKSFITQFLLPCLPLPSFPCLLFSLPLCHSPGGFLLFVSLASLH